MAVLVAFNERRELFPGLGTETRIATVILLVILGWALARALAQGLAPALFRRLDPATAGTVGFLLRLLTVVASVIVALRIAGVKPETLAVGGAFTAIILGLAAADRGQHVRRHGSSLDPSGSSCEPGLTRR